MKYFFYAIVTLVFLSGCKTVDKTAPKVTAPPDITVAATNSEGTMATNDTIAAFLSAASAEDDEDGTITEISNDAPKIFPLGVTYVKFSAADQAGNRGSDRAAVRVEDQDSPVIELLGDTAMTINAGGSFTDPGASAYDNVDGDISSNIEVSGKVDTERPGAYPLTYSVTDSAGNNAVPVTRTIYVDDLSHALMVLQVLAGYEPDTSAIEDSNADGKLDMIEVLTILQDK